MATLSNDHFIMRLQDAKQLARRFKGRHQAKPSCICDDARNLIWLHIKYYLLRKR